MPAHQRAIGRARGTMVEVELGGEALEARAEVIQGADRDRLLPRICALAPHFAKIQESVGRPIPVVELKRLVQLQRAYLHMNAGDSAIEVEDFARAQREYGAAQKLAPHIVEIPFWQAVALVGAGQTDQALPLFERVFAAETRWTKLLPRLVKAELLPNDPAVMARIFEAGLKAKTRSQDSTKD